MSSVNFVDEQKDIVYRKFLNAFICKDDFLSQWTDVLRDLVNIGISSVNMLVSDEDTLSQIRESQNLVTFEKFVVDLFDLCERVINKIISNADDQNDMEEKIKMFSDDVTKIYEQDSFSDHSITELVDKWKELNFDDELTRTINKIKISFSERQEYKKLNKVLNVYEIFTLKKIFSSLSIDIDAEEKILITVKILVFKFLNNYIP